jgi:protein-ribulosamine 3-kinase
LCELNIFPEYEQVSIGQRGKEMMFGEFESMKAIYSTIPDLTPRPIACGTYSSDPDIHFLLTEFHEVSDDLPHIQRFTSKVAYMHMNGKSPNGKYGFPITTFNGNLPQDNSWTDTWEEFYKQSLRRLLQFEEETQGPSQELTKLCGPLFDKVIPRLLRPLETRGNHIEPCLVHGDLWYANVFTDVDTDKPLVYSPCSFYAHNECGWLSSFLRRRS